jgi:FkbM family methyltransferase
MQAPVVQTLPEILWKCATRPAWFARRLRWELLKHMPPREVTVRTKNGLLTFNSADRVIGRTLVAERDFETHLIAEASALLRRFVPTCRSESAVLLDVGANLGMIAIAAIRFGYATSAVTIEPAPDTVRLLRRNVAQNGLADRVIVVEAAATDIDGTAPLALSSITYGDHRVASSGIGDRATVNVSARRIDDILDDLDPGLASRIALVWMDVQGHEYRALRGAQRLLNRGVPLCFELWPVGLTDAGATREDLLDQLTPHYTRVVPLAEGITEPQPFARLGAVYDAYRETKYFCNVLLLP